MGWLQGCASSAFVSVTGPCPCQIVQAEVEDMIWEVDEDCDGLVNWPEFQAMWQRCQEDKAGGYQLPDDAGSRGASSCLQLC